MFGEKTVTSYKSATKPVVSSDCGVTVWTKKSNLWLKSYKNNIKGDINMAKADLQQWQELGEQAKKVQKELFILLDVSNKTNVPKSITNHIVKSVTGVQNYKWHAENRLFEEYPNLDDEALNIFYGKQKEQLHEN